MAAVALMTRYADLIQRTAHGQGEVISKFDDLVTLPLHPQSDRLHHLDHYFLLPPLNQTTLGVLIYFHSCHQSGLEFFHLPEHRILALDALQRGLGVFAPTSTDRRSGCFTSKDVDSIPRLVDEWLEKHELKDLPRMAIGDSSGGIFLSFVWKDLDLLSMALYNTPLTDEWDLSLPTAVVMMALDDPIATKAIEHTAMLKQMNVSTQLFRVAPRPFVAALCTTRFPELPIDYCEQIFQTIRKSYSSLLDSSGFIKGKTKPPWDQWSSLLRKLDSSFQQRSHVNDPPRYDTARAGNGKSWLWAIIEQEIRSCQGYHAMTSEWHTEVINFLLINAEIVLQNNDVSSGNSTAKSMEDG